MIIYLYKKFKFVFIDILFPVLDITRLAVRNKHINNMLSSNKLIMNKLLPHIYDVGKPTNQMLAIRCLCNLMHHEKGEILLVKYYEEFLQLIQKLSNENISQKHLQVGLLLNLFCILNLGYTFLITNLFNFEQVAIATLLLNLSVMIKQSEDIFAVQNVIDTISMICPKLTEPEAMFRSFVAIGTLLSFKNPPTLSKQIRDYIELIASNSEPSKVLSCCKHIMSIITK